MDIVGYAHIGSIRKMHGDQDIIDVHVVMVFIQQDLDYASKEECGVKDKIELYLQKA